MTHPTVRFPLARRLGAALLLLACAAPALVSPAAAQTSQRRLSDRLPGRTAPALASPAAARPVSGARADVAAGNLVADPSFEAGTPNPAWAEASASFGSPLCTVAACGVGITGTGPRTGTWWAWFGGSENGDVGSMQQTVTIPATGSAELTFYLQIPTITDGVGTGFVAVRMDGTELFRATYVANQPTYAAYALVTVPVGAYADGAPHLLRFESTTTGRGNFFVDEVSITATGAPPVAFGPQADFATGLDIPISVTRLADGRVLIAELDGNRVSAYPAGGGARTDFAIGLEAPRGVTQLADGRVLVAESDASRVSAYPAAGGARTDFATGLAVPDGVTQLADGRVLVAEHDGGRVSAYPAAGGARTDFATGLSGPNFVTQLADGRVLVGEEGSNRVSVFPLTGGVRTEGMTDFAVGVLTPEGITQLADDRVLVAEFFANRVSAYPAGGGGRTDFATGLVNPTGVTQLADGRVLVAEFNGTRTVQFAPVGEAVAITEARFYNPTAAQGDGAGYRLLGAPVAGFDVTALAARNLVQGIAAGADPATHPAQYPTAPGPNLLTAYTGNGTFATPDADDVLEPGRGFFWYLYDRTITGNPDPAGTNGGGTSNSVELTTFALAAFGPQAEADVSLNFADTPGGNFQMLANPFARPLAVSGITAGGGTLQGGVVQAYNPNGGGYALRMGADRLGTWQGAFAELTPTAPGGAVTVTYAFAWTDGNVSPVFVGRPAEAGAGAPSVRFALAGTLASGATVADDAAIVRFADGAEAGWDALDASKLTPPNATRAMIAPTIARDGAAYRLALDSRPLDQSASIPLSVSATEAGAFTLSWTSTLPEGWMATLTDTQTGQTTDVTRASETTFSTAAAQDWTERFALAVRPSGATAGEGNATLAFSLSTPAPNPARGRTTLTFSLAEAGAARLTVVDLLGREVAVIAEGDQAAGRHVATLDTGALAPGVYVVRLASGAQQTTQRLVVVR